MSHRRGQPKRPWAALIARLGQPLRRLHRDEGGATLTEFVITLPIFLLVFNGVMILGQFTRKGSETPIRAYKQTFTKVLPFQKSKFDFMHMHVIPAAGDATSQLYGSSKVHNKSTAVKLTAGATETATYVGMGVGGHMGESYARADAITAIPGTKLKGCDGIGPGWPSGCIDLNNSSGTGAFSTSNGHLTSKMKNLTGGSKLAFALFNDGVSAPSFSGGSGVIGMLNQFMTAAGVRPALAANIRYGTVSGQASDSLTFAGQTMPMNAYYSVLVPPSPKGPLMDAGLATLVVRATMQGQSHYKFAGHQMEPAVGFDQLQCAGLPLMS